MSQKYSYLYNFHTIGCCWITFVASLALFNIVETVPISQRALSSMSSELDKGKNSLGAAVTERIESAPTPLTRIRVGGGGCRYQASVYSSGDLVPIEEPCLNCQCKNTAVVCKLRICSDVQVPPPGCILVHKVKKCCPQVVCPENTTPSNRRIASREHRSDLSNHTNSLALPEDKGFCVYDGTVYAEGSAMRASSLCEYCFCIRGEMKCSSPQCIIPLDGCRPKFRSYACCPTNYDCHESNSTAIIKTIPNSTPIPPYLKGCQVAGRFVREGEPVLPLTLEPDLQHMNPCQTCFCMGGVIRCRPLECDKPIEGCKPLIKPGHCCPDRYECPTNATVVNSKVIVSPESTVSVLESNVIKPQESESLKSGHLTLNQISVNEILTSRIASKNNLNNEEFHSSGSDLGSPIGYEATVGVRTLKTHSSDMGSREERQKKDKEGLQGITLTGNDKEGLMKDEVSEVSNKPSSDSTVQDKVEGSDLKEPFETSVTTEISSTTTTTSTSPIEVAVETTASISSSGLEEKQYDEISQLLSSATANHQYDEESDGEELTIALKVITENPTMVEAETTPISINTPSSVVQQSLNLVSTVGTSIESSDPPTDKPSIGNGDENEGNDTGKEQDETTTMPTVKIEAPSTSHIENNENEQSAITLTSMLETVSQDDGEITTIATSFDEPQAIESEPESSFGSNLYSTSERISDSSSTTQIPPLASQSESVSSDHSSPAMAIPPEGSLTNLQFIPFGVEDALILGKDPNEISQAPIRITVDNPDHKKASLIGGNPSKVFVHVPLLVQQNDEEDDDEFSKIITENPNLMSEYKKTGSIVGDVPVSSSLYNNGYFPSRIPPKFQNKTVFDQIFEDSRMDNNEDDEAEAVAAEMMEISNKSLTNLQNVSKVLEESKEVSGIQQDKHSKNTSNNEDGNVKGNPTNNFSMSTNKVLDSTSLLPPSTISTTTTEPISDIVPNRIYSKFHIHDSPLFQRFGGTGYDLSQLAIIAAAAAAAKKQGMPLNHPDYHHRYYNHHTEPNKGTGFYPFAGGDYTTDGDVDENGGDEDEDEILIYEDELQSGETKEPISFSAKLEKLSQMSQSLGTQFSSPPHPPSSLSPVAAAVAVPTNSLPKVNGPSKIKKPLYQSTSSTKITTHRPLHQLPKSTLVFSPSNAGAGGFKPVVSYPFIPFPKNKPLDELLHIGLKLSGCNIYGKMYGVGNIIRELSSNCVQCQCTEVGVQCSEIHCDFMEDDDMR